MKTSDGKEKVEDEHMDLPPGSGQRADPSSCSRICDRDALPSSVSFVAATPKPRLVKLRVMPSRHRPVFHCRVGPQGHALRAESRHRRIRRPVRPAHWEATAGLSRLDTGRRSSGLRAIASADVHGRTALADGPREPCLARRAMSHVDVGPVVVSVEDARPDATRLRDAVFWFDRKATTTTRACGRVTRRRRRGRRRHDGADVCKNASGARPARVPRGGRNVRFGSERAFLRARLRRTRNSSSAISCGNLGRDDGTQTVGVRLGRRERDPPGGSGGPDRLRHAGTGRAFCGGHAWRSRSDLLGARCPQCLRLPKHALFAREPACDLGFDRLTLARSVSETPSASTPMALALGCANDCWKQEVESSSAVRSRGS